MFARSSITWPMSLKARKPIIMGTDLEGRSFSYSGCGLRHRGSFDRRSCHEGRVALPFSEIRATFPVLHNPANLHRAVPITEEEFHYAFTNNLSDEESKIVYDLRCSSSGANPVSRWIRQFHPDRIHHI